MDRFTISPPLTGNRWPGPAARHRLHIRRSRLVQRGYSPDRLTRKILALYPDGKQALQWRADQILQCFGYHNLSTAPPDPDNPALSAADFRACLYDGAFIHSPAADQLKKLFLTLLYEHRLHLAVNRFDREFHQDLEQFARQSRYHLDLLTSFPALPFALITRYGTYENRHHTRMLIYQGASLKKLAAALALPFWTRKLSPEALTMPFGDFLPAAPCFERELPNLIPERADLQGNWLRALLVARRANDNPAFLLWLARQRHWLQRLRSHAYDVLVNLAAWAWHSQRPHLPASQLISGHWSPQIGLTKALSHSGDWYLHLMHYYHMGPALANPWLPSTRHGDLAFEPVLTPDQLVSIAATMRNCIRDYGGQLGLNDCRLFYVTDSGQPAAMIELRPSIRHPNQLAIHQLKGPGNVDVSQALRKQIINWFYSHSPAHRATPPDHGDGEFHDDVWHQFWRPYWRARGQYLRDIASLQPNPSLATKIINIS